MALIPLSKVQCGLPKTRKYPIDVPGTSNISYGHKLRERRGSCQIAKCQRTAVFEGAEERGDGKREYEQVLKTVEFEKETNRKIKNKSLRQQIEQGIDGSFGLFLYFLKLTSIVK